MIYAPEHFVVQELVDPEIYRVCGDDALALIDPNALRALDLLRQRFGTLVVNNWHNGGDSFTGRIYKESGLRRKDTATGSKNSQHKIGRAFDCKFKDYEPAEVFAFITGNPDEFSLIRRLEDVKHTSAGIGWLHFDTKETGMSGIQVFRP